MSHFVNGATDVLTLPDGATVIVRRRLNTGETHALAAAMMRAPTAGDDRLRVDPLKVGLETAVAYLVDWTLTDGGRPVPLRGLAPDEVRSSINMLEADVFQDMRQAIDAHVERQAAERAAEKKSQATAIGSSPTSPSPSVAAGGTNG
jgi:hypothetical protein